MTEGDDDARVASAIPEDVITSVVPRWHFRHIPDDVLPALTEAGVSDAEIHQMLVDNPRRILETKLEG